MTNEKERDRISFRLRNVDADLRQATKELTSDKLSDLARDGLRLILGIRTTMRVEITERPIVITAPKRTEEPASLTPQITRNKPFVPNQQRRGGDQRGTGEMLRN